MAQFFKVDSWEMRAARRIGKRAHERLIPRSETRCLTAAPKRHRGQNRWNGVYDHPRPKAVWSDLFKEHDRYVAHLVKRGFELLGGGAYSSVYGKPGCSKVLKVCHRGDDDVWPLYAQWAFANPSPFVPVIHSFKRHKGFYVAVIERMEIEVAKTPDTAGHKRAVMMFRDYVEGGEETEEGSICPVLNAVMGLYPGIRGTLDGLREAFDGKVCWDMHQYNWMLRPNGELVITDPISGSYSAGDASAVVRIKGTGARLSA